MITYYLVVPFLYFFSYLPTPVLYGLSNVLAFVLRDLVRYRRAVVYSNLRGAFPNKTEEEINAIARESYTHLADRVVENIKCLTISRSEYMRRCTVENIEVLNDLYHQKRDVVLMLAHIGSWEWAGYVAHTLTPFKIYGIYNPAKNKRFNDLIIGTRGKLGMNLISMKDTSAYFKEKPEEQTMHIFFTDQSPSNPNNAYWTTFMSRPTPFFYGGARYAIKHNCIPVYAAITQKSRGHYHVYLTRMMDDVSNCQPDDIVQRFAELQEQQLHRHPADWLWSHKRWKHSK